MLTYNTQYGYANSLPLDRLRTAAWVQHLLDRLERVAHAMIAGGDAGMAEAGRATLDRLRVNAPRDASLLDPLFTAVLGNDGRHGNRSGTAYGSFAGAPARRELLLVERYVPGSKHAFDAAHGVMHAYASRDQEVGWAALESIEAGIGRPAPAGEDGEPVSAVRAARNEGLPAGRIIDGAIGRTWQPDESTRRFDEMVALVDFAAAIAADTPVTLAAYGGDYNSVACAIRGDRSDLASVDGLLAALAVCRLEQLTDAGSFWTYYLLAGIVIASPDAMREMGTHFYDDAWRCWIDALLALPASGELGHGEEEALSQLEASMSFVARRNPIVHTRRKPIR
ncbi:hypothetical protein [Burkholderia alba]|uniref:hypothetical protein n=1 Tax=Burkholderia alba TaxID=2683677 RepID=UPI002B052FDF|nr:hypothetical protein [Burkholderia alba]